MGGIPRDWDEGLSGLRQIEVELFGQHGLAEKSTANVVDLTGMACLFIIRCV